MQLLVDASGVVSSWGSILSVPLSAPAGTRVVDLADAEIPKLTQRGTKTLLADGTLSVVLSPSAVADDVAADLAFAAAAATRAAILPIAQSAVGVALLSLTAAQQRALLACLLFRVGALDSSLNVRPLATWVV
jgi:hypothetical protein